MKKKLLTIALFAAFLVVACKKDKKHNLPVPVATNSIKAPTGFKWENSRNIIFTVNITDSRFQSSMYLVAIYDGDPIAGGKLLSKGSATTLSAFSSKIYLSKQVNQVYIVKTAPDGSKVTQKTQVGMADITASIGAD
ncbi:hypothetical protein [Mucilaginibacter lappiensis]|uniref:hypothetical protein n=1 Tax=Mucilaginibacter lappiensis TaxID=354630 RepID=UPI003D240BC6